MRHVTAFTDSMVHVTMKTKKQYTFSVMVRPALINSFRYEYACSGLVNISYRNINHSFIGNLSAVEDGNGEGARIWGEGKKEKHTERVRIGEMLRRVGVRELERQRMWSWCVCVCVCAFS